MSEATEAPVTEQVEPAPPRWSSFLRSPLCGLTLFFVGLILRLLGLGWGLPNPDRAWSLHPDEAIVIFVSQQLNPAQGDFTPNFYNYGTLYLTLSRVGSDLFATYAPTKDPTLMLAQAHLAGRFLSVFAGAALVWIVWAVALRLTRPIGAILAALLVACAPGLVMHSRFQTVDSLFTTLTFAGVAAAFFLMPGRNGEAARPAIKWAVIAGVLAGLAAGTKYTGILALLAPLAILTFEARAGRMTWMMAIRAGVYAGIAAVLAFLISTPGVVTEQTAFLRDFRYEIEHTSEGHGLVFIGTAPAALYHFGNLTLALGLLGVLLGLYGLITAARKEAWAVATLVFFGLFYFVLARAEVKFVRYVFPLIPVLALGVAYAVTQWHEKGTFGAKIGVVAGLFAVTGLGGGGLIDSLQLSARMASEDPRDQVGRELRATLPTETVGLVSDPWFYSPTLWPEAAAPRFIPKERRMAPAGVVGLYGPEWNVEALEAQRPIYVVFSSFESDDLARIARMTPVPEAQREVVERFTQFRDALQRDYELVKRVGGGYTAHDMMYTSPEVWVWKRKTSSTNSVTDSSTTSGSTETPAPTP